MVTKLLLEAKENFQQKYNQYKKKGYELSEQEFLNLCKMDPTSNGMLAGKYFDWMYKQQMASFSDYMMEQTRYYLTEFERSKVALQRAGLSTNIMDYEDCEVVMNALSKIDVWDNLVRRFGNQIRKIYEDDKFFVIQCLTHEAERAFGKYSHWCTAAIDDDKFFRAYNSQNMLFICVPKENGTPNIKSDYIMQCDVSTGPYGEGKPKFHCADKADKVFSSFKQYFTQYPQYADAELCLFLHENYDSKFMPIDEDMSIQDMDRFQQYLYENEGVIAEAIDFAENCMCSHEAYEDENGNQYAFFTDSDVESYLLDDLDETEDIDYYWKEYADWDDVETCINEGWFKECAYSYAESYADDMDFDRDEDGRTEDEVADDLYYNYEDGDQRVIQALQPYMQPTDGMDEDDICEMVQEACRQYVSRNVNFSYNEDGQDRDAAMESMVDSISVDTLREFYETPYDVYQKGGIDEDKWKQHYMQSMDDAYKLDRVTVYAARELNYVTIDGVGYNLAIF